MHVLTLVGDRVSGKTALCQLWSGLKHTNSYMTTIQVCSYNIRGLLLYDTPSLQYFAENIEYYYTGADVILLVANEDSTCNTRYLRISHLYPDIPWFLILNGDGYFPTRRLWALENDIRVFQLNTKTGKNVIKTLEHIQTHLEDIPIRTIRDNTIWGYWPILAFYSIYERIISSILGTVSGEHILSK